MGIVDFAKNELDKIRQVYKTRLFSSLLIGGHLAKYYSRIYNDNKS